VKQSIRIPKAGPFRDAVIQRMVRYLSLLPADKEYRADVDEYRKTRSDSQNKYLWGAVYPTILKDGNLDGWHAEDLHEYFLGEHFGWETVEGFGRKRMRPIKRSSRLSTVEFADYVDFIQRKAAELGIYIADPE
jgi:hypothetical protein